MTSVPPVAPAAPGGAATCWNCRQPLQQGAERCLWCGVPLQAAPVQFVIPPGAPAAAPQQVSVAPAPGQVATSAPHVGSTRIALDPHFSGGAASVGAQVAAFTIDVALVAVIVAAAALLTGSAVLAVLALLESVVILWVLQARTGASPGNALLRLRLSRDDAPYSAGTGRALLRGLVTAAGFLVAGVGAWVVAASGGRDARARSWADRAARTQVVAVPRRSRSVPVRVAAYAQPAPGVQLDYGASDAPIVLAAPQVVSMSARQATVDEVSASASQTGAQARGAEAVVVAPMPEPAGLAPEVQATVRKEGATATLLLVFDSGQREELATPVAINIGRSPVASEPGDRLIAVKQHESTVSKTHARLEHSRGSTWVTDFGSTNGTDLLTDEGDVIPLTPNVRTPLEEGTRVRIGNRVFTVSVLLGGQ